MNSLQGFLDVNWIYKDRIILSCHDGWGKQDEVSATVPFKLARSHFKKNTHGKHLKQLCINIPASQWAWSLYYFHQWIHFQPFYAVKQALTISLSWNTNKSKWYMVKHTTDFWIFLLMANIIDSLMVLHVFAIIHVDDIITDST